ncbi:MAG: TldD protein, part of TldE/TldD proteolytic complex [uncultured Thiotrichaceae bacterium]|uniref:TldD protein, part of TldE/TldD proteolytic complex n=1 Tax=uncultured Thiotrichaceae bacterium TaxID=298394 RepID=A0A6S6SGR5_9GAMM|nr:MAG: TldD protein, part of TldE/TldD proteolytic complex [uncultured Thiotrichaceae bacterium]
MSNESMDIAQESILNAAGLTESHLDQVFSELNYSGIDLADVYFQSSRFESWSMEEQIVKGGSYSIEQGFGIRAVSGEQTGFAYSDEINFEALIDSAKAARAIANLGQSQSVQAWRKPNDASPLYLPENPLTSLSETEKIALLALADEVARAESEYVQEVIPSLSASYEVILVADNSGNLISDVRPLVRMNVTVIVEKNGERESAGFGGGGRHGLSWFEQEDRVRVYAKEAVRLALVNLEAIPAPAGTMDVVLGNGWPGILLHEAVGHGLEGDFNRKGTSAFSGRIGEQVAAKGVTVVDDGTLEGCRGSLTVDDEGTPTQCTTLIEDGELKGYMQDKLNAKLMDTQSTGNGRRESYSHLPMPRMTNTYMLPGEHDPQEIIESVENGIYAVSFGGGQVDITSGKFVFSSSEAYLIENGKLGAPIKGATLIGNGPDAMSRISMIGNDLALDSGVGVCGKAGQSVPVGVGQPTLRINQLTVGGTA